VRSQGGETPLVIFLPLSLDFGLMIFLVVFVVDTAVLCHRSRSANSIKIGGQGRVVVYVRALLLLFLLNTPVPIVEAGESLLAVRALGRGDIELARNASFGA
jgi:hypothetical protein